MNDLIEIFIQENYPPDAEVEKLSGGGSGRSYYRMVFGDKQEVICHNANVRENECFFFFSKKIANILPHSIPTVYGISKDKKIYSQSDFGNESLLTFRQENPSKSMVLYKKAVSDLASIQFELAKNVNKEDFFDSPVFDEMLVYRDLFYFKDYFLDFSTTDYNQHLLLQDFTKIAKQFTSCPNQYFLYRDFQARNILVKEDSLCYIDYQGGMIGPSAYDLVSLLWQAKANLESNEKEMLIEKYLAEMLKINPKFDKSAFWEDYNISLVLRLLQVMGAYSKLGVIGGKTYFKESLSAGLQNLKSLLAVKVMDEYPEIKRIIENLEPIKN